MTSAIGIDVGTTNVKVVLVRDDGRLLAGATRSLAASRADGRAELDAELLWSAVLGAVAEVTAAVPDAAEDVEAVGVCSQWSSTVPVAADGTPVGPMLLWSDQRGTQRCHAILGEHEAAFLTWIDHHGIPPIGGGLSLGHLLHLQHDDPAVHDRAAALLEPMDYVTARLTGRLSATQATMFPTQLCDNRTSGATAYDDELVAMAGVDASRLPSLLAFDAAVGEVRPDVAAALGVPSSAVVYAGVNDTHAGALATGALRPGRGGLATGTTSVLFAALDAKREDLDHELLAMPGPFAGEYVVMAENGLGGAAVTHVLDGLLLADDALGAHRADDPFAHLEEVLGGASDDGALFLPWLNGSMAPQGDGSARGAFLGLSLATTREDLVRAAVEGAARNVAWLLPHVEAFTGDAVATVAFVGGAARSPGWCQVLADVLARPVDQVAHPDRAVGRAAALLGLVRHGALARGDLDALVEVAATYEPDPARRERSDARQAAFEAAHGALGPLSSALGG